MFLRRTALIILFVSCITAQPVTQEGARFEAASVRVNNSGLPFGNTSGTDRIRFSAGNITLKSLVTMAWTSLDYQIVGGPAWIDSARFDITAKAEHEADWDGMMLMLQKLLQDRFKLVVHRERRDGTVYAIVPAKGGMKLHAKECAAGDNLCGRLRIFANGMQGQTSMPLLAHVLSDMLMRPVLDDTKFAGPFDVQLRWTPDESTPGRRSGDSLPAIEGAPSFLTALEEQLGLKLNSRQGLMETLVIEHAEKPVAN